MVSRLGQEIGKTGPFESLEQEVLLNCLRTADRLMRSVAITLRPVNLTGTQYNVLRILRGVSPQGLPCQEIMRRMIARDADLTRLLDRLEKRSLVERQRQTDDRRVVLITITPGGLELLAGLDETVNKAHHVLLGHMPPERLAELSRLLEQARERAED
jgi:DNA-binding MarR family transcriptional regulator